MLTFWLHSLLPHFPAIVVVVVVAAADGVRRYRQTSWHVQKVLLTCHVHRDVASSQLVLVWLLWRRGVNLSWLVSSVCAMVVVGG